MMTLLLLSVGCAKTHVTDNFCLWFEPISLLNKEIDDLSEESLRQIDKINNEFEEQCSYD